MVAGFAVLVSLASAYVSVRAYRDSIANEILDQTYEEFNALGELRMNHWETAHLADIPEEYERSCSMIRRGLGDIDDAKRCELLVKERSFAIRIFSMFEQVLYQHDNARGARDAGRAQFLDEVLGYFTGRLLLNPRLVYYWLPDGGGLRALFEPRTREYFESALSRSGTFDQDRDADPEGPYGLLSEELVAKTDSGLV